MRSTDYFAGVKAPTLALFPNSGGALILITAGGAGDNAELTSSAVDVTGARTARLLIAWVAKLGAAETATVTVKLHESAVTGSGFAIVKSGTLQSAVVWATGPEGGGTVSGCYVRDLDLSQCKGFLKALVTCNLSAANTDTMSYTVVVLPAGYQIEPQSSAAPFYVEPA